MNKEFNQHIIQYMTHCYSRQLRPKTMHSYESTLRLFERWCKEELGIETVDEITENTIRHYISDIQQRGNRNVFFSSKTETILRHWLSFKDRHVESEYLFPMKHNGEHITVSAFERNFKVYLKRASIKGKYSPHCLRNNFAKRCLMSGMDIYTLSRILGHSRKPITSK